MARKWILFGGMVAWCWTLQAEDQKARLLLFRATGEGPDKRVIQDLAEESETLRTASGLALTWRASPWNSRPISADLVEVTLEGHCAPDGRSANVHQGVPFGWVNQVDGRILPFIFVNCDRILRAIMPFVELESRASRDRLFARALLRVTAHELRHVIEQTSGHEQIGVGRASLTAEYLISPWHGSIGDWRGPALQWR